MKIALFAFIAYFLISFCSLQYKIYKKNQSLEKAKQSYQAEQEENEALKEKHKNFDEESYAERIAREVLGYGFPDEKEYREAS
ncbi:MAG: septum formation initiator family protein [Clostridia bacterium]|nr:septum formation initiator family protein [Clostridia bacterium]